MPRHSATSKFALTCAVLLAATLAGCENRAQIFQDNNEGGFFDKPVDIFKKPDWARPSANTASLGPSGPVGAEELVSADGQCAPAAPGAQAAAPAQPAAAPQPAAAAGGAGTGFEGGLQPSGGPGVGAPPPVTGGIALGMTECEAVRRAGHPSNVAISMGDGGARKVVLTYLDGPWPGIYTFSSGRLKVVDEAPQPVRPKAKPRKKALKKHARAATGAERMYVQ